MIAKPASFRLGVKVTRVPGFTLLEVIMGVVLISLLSGGIYGIANASMDLGKSVSDHRLKELRASGLGNLLRDGLGSLPPGSRLELPRADGLSGSERRVRVVDSPRLWGWSGATASADAVEIFPVVAEGGGVDLMLAHLWLAEGEEIDDVEAQFEEFSRTRLLSLVNFWWEFLDSETGEWKREWDGEVGERPELVAAYFRLPGDPEVRRQVIAVAPVAELEKEEEPRR